MDKKYLFFYFIIIQLVGFCLFFNKIGYYAYIFYIVVFIIVLTIAIKYRDKYFIAIVLLIIINFIYIFNENEISSLSVHNDNKFVLLKFVSDYKSSGNSIYYDSKIMVSNIDSKSKNIRVYVDGVNRFRKEGYVYLCLKKKDIKKIQKINSLCLNKYCKYYLLKSSHFSYIFRFRKRIFLLLRKYQLYTKSVVYSIITGDKIFLRKSLENRFKLSGCAHLLAISGLHIGVFLYLVILLSKYTNSKTLSLFTLIIALIYLVLIDFKISAIRSVMMILFFYTLSKYSFEYDSDRFILNIYIISFFLLGKNLFSISFILSYQAIIGIFFIYSLICDSFLKKYKIHLFFKMFLVSFSIQISQILFLNYTFDSIIINSFIFNIFVIPYFSIFYIISFFSIFIDLCFLHNIVNSMNILFYKLIDICSNISISVEIGNKLFFLYLGILMNILFVYLHIKLSGRGENSKNNF